MRVKMEKEESEWRTENKRERQNDIEGKEVER